MTLSRQRAATLAMLVTWLAACGPPAPATRRPPRKPPRQALREVKPMRPCPALVPGKAVRYFSELDLRISAAKRRVRDAYYAAAYGLKDPKLASCLDAKAEALEKILERLDDRTSMAPLRGQFLQALARYAATEYARARAHVAAARRCIASRSVR